MKDLSVLAILLLLLSLIYKKASNCSTRFRLRIKVIEIPVLDARFSFLKRPGVTKRSKLCGYNYHYS